jgi:DNA-binding response OmpR family regulator
VAGKPRILVVDDEAVMADVLKMAFGGRGWVIDVATNVADALQRFRNARPDVVLTDKNLPDRSGVELIQEIRKRDEAVGIVLMTGYGTVESARDTLNIGVDAYLEKPFDNVFDVVATAQALVDRSAARLASPAAAAKRDHIVAVLAATDPLRRALIAAPLAATRIVYVNDSSLLRTTAQQEHADLIVLDGKAFPDEITPLVAGLRARVREAACVVLSETLSLSDVKRLIELEVKALIDQPLESDRFAAHLTAALDRVRRSRK